LFHALIGTALKALSQRMTKTVIRLTSPSFWKTACSLAITVLLFVIASSVCGANLPPVQTVFIILMENSNWGDIEGNIDAPYLNHTLLPLASYCEQYYTPPGLHPSEPNYLWLEAGTNFNVFDNRDPDANHQNTPDHFVTLLKNAGISWRSYQEDISGDCIPLTSTNAYTPRHNPFVYFDDVTGTNNPTFQYGLTNIRPYTELAGDLINNKVARYNFITPNLCNDMHDPCYPTFNSFTQGDNWLASEVPKILNSAAYQNDGALFIVWDEGLSNTDGPIGMILLSPLARGGGYFNNIHYTHSSTLRTFQEIFGVMPLLGDAANATDFADLFCRYRLTNFTKGVTGAVQFDVTGVIPGKTNLIQVSNDLSTWISIRTNSVALNNFSVTDSSATNSSQRFYRAVQLP
jgi:hypothetical protein